jgi:DnaJ-class molecular chaperone
MSIIRTYLTGCTWCNATGEIDNPNFNPYITASTIRIPCPVCNGAKTIIVTETIPENVTGLDSILQEKPTKDINP